MTEEMKLPDIAENVDSGEVVNILVHEGDRIRNEQPILEIETDKASFEVPSSMKGKVTRITVSRGETVKVGQTLMLVENETGTTERKPETGTGIPDESSPTEEHGTRDTAILDRGAAFRKAGPGPLSGKAAEAPYHREERKISEREEWRDRRAPHPGGPSARSAGAAGVPAAPSVRRKARELGIDITEVSGSGPGGRILAGDVTAFARDEISRRETRQAAHLPDFSEWGATRREKLSNVNLLTAENLSTSWRTIPHVTQFDSAGAGELERFRREYDALLERRGIRLRVTPILVKIVAEGLRFFPRLNASIDMRSRELVFKEYIHIGVAVDTPRGLLVPVLRNADRKGIVLLARELNDLADRARSKKIEPAEMQGGTFTVSNLGGLGGTHFTPIIPHPQVSILGVGRIQPQSVSHEGVQQMRSMLPLSLSYDHRVVDGAQGTRFLRWIVEAIENPFRIFLDEGAL